MEDSQGTTLTFGGTSYELTKVKVTKTGTGGDQKVDVSTLATTGARVYEDPALFDYGPNGLSFDVSIEFFGSSLPEPDAEAVLVCSRFGLNGDAICSQSEVEAAVGEKIKGTATFKYKVSTD